MINNPQISGRIMALVGTLIILFVSGFLCLSKFEKLVIYNPTSSVEKGFYIYAGQDHAKKNLILFLTPQVVKDYTQDNYSKSPLKHFLKPVLAMAGDHVCYQDGRVFLNGDLIAQVQKYDSAGKPLPVWKECRDLKKNEYFVFSDRVSNSLDSRYYGPILKENIVGVFKPIFGEG